MQLVPPFWFKQRQGKAEPAGETMYRLTAPQQGEAFIRIEKDDGGRWSAAMRMTADGPDVAAAPAEFRNPGEAWDAAFELYRQRVIVQGLTVADGPDDWLKLCATLGAPEVVSQRVFERLAHAYASPGRFYHTPEHIAQVLRTLHELRGHALNYPALQLAAWFHDAVYDPRAKDNEERSADLAEKLLPELSVGPETIAEIRRLILLTKTHAPEEQDLDGRLLIDADLAILGAPPDEYQRYATAIRQEYAWVPEDAYRKGRVAVLEGFLRRDRLFRTAELTALDPIARQNLATEMDSLRS